MQFRNNHHLGIYIVPQRAELNLHHFILGSMRELRIEKGGRGRKRAREREGEEKKSVRVAIRAAKNSLRNKQAAWTSVPCRPIHHADLERGQEEEGEGRREGGREREWEEEEEGGRAVRRFGVPFINQTAGAEP